MVKLLESAENIRKTFEDHNAILTSSQSTIIKKFSDLVVADVDSIKRNHIKKKAQSQLQKLWSKDQELFIIVSLSFQYPTRLVSPDWSNCFQSLAEWWDRVQHPKGLREVIDRNHSILPPVPKSGMPKQSSYRC
jgi:hypothetical protein